MDNETSPYDPPKTISEPTTAVPPPIWRQRRFAFAFTMAAIVIASLLFTLLFRNLPGDKPIFLCRMLLGPFGWILGSPPIRVPWSSMLIVVPPTFAYTAYPCCLTALISCVGVFFWWGCGVVAATGGV
jgi:hypothetical protein